MRSVEAVFKEWQMSHLEDIQAATAKVFLYPNTRSSTPAFLATSNLSLQFFRHVCQDTRFPPAQLEESADYCAVGDGGVPTSIVKVITSEEVHYPVLIDHYCPENTVLTGDGGKFHHHNCANFANKIC